MPQLPPYLSAHPQGTRLTVHASPGAKASTLQGLHGQALKIRLAAAAVEGAANAELIRFLAEKLSLPQRNITLLSGQTARHKVLLLAGLTPEQTAPLLPA